MILRVIMVLALFGAAAPAVWREWRSERAWAALRASGVLRIGIDPSAQPLSFFMPDGWTGYEADMARALAADMGLASQAVLIGYDGRFDALQTGQIDVFISAATLEDGRPDFVWSESYLDMGTRLIAPVRANVRQAADLEHRRVAVARGSAADRSVRYWVRRVAGLERVAVEDDVRAIEELRAGRVAAVFVSAEAALRAGCPLRGSGENGAGERCVAISPTTYAVLMRAGEQRLLHEINAALRRLREGELPRRWQVRWFSPTSAP